MKIPRHPLMVMFEEIECCALRRAFSTGACAGISEEIIAEIADKEDVSLQNISILRDIFVNTLRLGFIPAPVHRIFYAKVAIMERDSLKQGEVTSLVCGHTPIEHIKALGKIIWLMSHIQPQN